MIQINCYRWNLVKEDSNLGAATVYLCCEDVAAIIIWNFGDFLSAEQLVDHCALATSQNYQNKDDLKAVPVGSAAY